MLAWASASDGLQTEQLRNMEHASARLETSEPSHGNSFEQAIQNRIESSRRGRVLPISQPSAGRWRRLSGVDKGKGEDELEENSVLPQIPIYCAT